jgi:predicted DNA-binding transcriptional regulator AlpA
MDRATESEVQERTSETEGIERLAQRLGIGRRLCYEKARKDDLPVPVIKIGRRLLVSKAAVDRLLGVEETAT